MGVTAAEREVGQRLLIDLRIDVGECDATVTDRIEDTVDYAQVCDTANLVAQQRTYKTLERLCAAIADQLLEHYDADAVWVKTAKPEPPIALPVSEVSVEVWREARMTPGLSRARIEHRRPARPPGGGGGGVARARRHVLASSSVYETEPVGLVLDQREFYNACVRIETDHEPEELLDACKEVERSLGREPGGARHGPRVIDVDVLLLAARVPLGAADAPAPRGDLAAVRARAAARARSRTRASRRDVAGRGARRARGDGQEVRRAGRRCLVLARCCWSSTSATPKRTSACSGTARRPVSEHWRFATVRDSTGDELGAALANLLGAAGAVVHRRRPLDRVLDRAAALASVDADGPALPRPRDAGRRTVDPHRDADPLDNPYEVGADRLANAVAAYDRVHDTCVVVDFGTAITYDIVSAAGEYLGGIITPGAEISIDALYDRAAKLPEGRARRAARADRQVDRRRDPQRDRVRVRRSGRGDRPPATRRARRRTTRDRHRRPRRAARASRPRGDRRGRRPAHADRASADLGAELSRLTDRARERRRPGVLATVAARIRNVIRRRSSGFSAAYAS